MIQQLEARRLLTTVAPGGEGTWGTGNDYWPNGTVVNGSSETIYVYVSGEINDWVPLPPNTHTPDHCDADAWTFDPSATEGPRDTSGDPLARKVSDGHTGKAMDNDAGDGVQHDEGGSSSETWWIVPERMNNKHPKDLPPGHNGTPDSDLPDDLDRGDAFDFWYDDPANDMDDPNDPGYRPPRPPLEPEEEPVEEEEEESDPVDSNPTD